MVVILSPKKSSTILVCNTKPESSLLNRDSIAVNPISIESSRSKGLDYPAGGKRLQRRSIVNRFFLFGIRHEVDSIRIIGGFYTNNQFLLLLFFSYTAIIPAIPVLKNGCGQFFLLNIHYIRRQLALFSSFLRSSALGEIVREIV